MTDAALLAGLLDAGDAAGVGVDDFAGPHGPALRRWQGLGLLARDPSAHPAPGCPHCGEGVPHAVGDRHVCDHCFSAVDPQWLLFWPWNPAAYLRRVAEACRIRGEVRRVDGSLWQLGTWVDRDERTECFFRGGNPLGAAGRARLAAYRRVLVFFGRTRPRADEHPAALTLSVVELPGDGVPPPGTDLGTLLRPQGSVRFDAHSGALWLGGRLLGEVPPGSKEYFFLHRLAEELDHFVPYRELKRAVLRQAGSADATDEATFCQKLKSRIKARWVTRIDELLATTNKGDGYRLRGHLVTSTESVVDINPFR
jgi:hypothetical protein